MWFVLNVWFKWLKNMACVFFWSNRFYKLKDNPGVRNGGKHEIYHECLFFSINRLAQIWFDHQIYWTKLIAPSELSIDARFVEKKISIALNSYNVYLNWGPFESIVYWPMSILQYTYRGSSTHWTKSHGHSRKKIKHWTHSYFFSSSRQFEPNKL